MKNIVEYIGLNFGADPELFLSIRGKIIGSEKAIPEDGLGPHATYVEVAGKQTVVLKPQIIRDGVQVEFNVIANSCRQSFSTNLAQCFRFLADHLAKQKGVFAFPIKPVFNTTVEVSPDEMKTLHPKSQQFGCAPSENAYGKSEISISDASQYYFRSAGGHIHLGLHSSYLKDPNTTVMMLDILLGNTCVLIDRDPGNLERRKVYGKAGEYRLPKHGLEYRVLSNFWLRSYQTMSFVLGMARLAVSVACNKEMTKKFLSLVDMQNVRDAINNNDYDKALDNFNAIKDLLRDTISFMPQGRDYVVGMDETYPLEGNRMDAFMFFVEKGLDHWFGGDIMKHWINHNYRERHGWENFLTEVVMPQMAQGGVAKKELVAA